MQILIDISDKAYYYAKTRMALFLDVNTEILKAVENGTVLPEHHGALKDTDAIIEQNKKERPFSIEIPLWKISEANTIIPATKGENDDDN